MNVQPSLTDRYVAAAVRSLPEDQRADVERELRASIEDDVDARVDAGAAPEAAERDVLTGLGDPAGLAARYSDRPLFLVGPTNFLFYRRSVLALLAIVVPLAALGSGVGHAIAGEGIGAIAASAVVTALSAAMHVAFWVTLVFAILDWTGASRGGPLVRWTVDMLPDVPEERARRGDTIASLVLLALVAGFFVYQQFLPLAWNADGAVDGPLLDPALWSSWIPVLLGLVVAEGVFTVVKQRTGGWTWPLAIINTAIAAASAAIVAGLALSGSLYDATFLAAFEWSSRPGAIALVGVMTAVVSVGIAAWDAIDGIVRTARSPRSSAGTRTRDAVPTA